MSTTYLVLRLYQRNESDGRVWEEVGTFTADYHDQALTQAREAQEHSALDVEGDYLVLDPSSYSCQIHRVTSRVEYDVERVPWLQQPDDNPPTMGAKEISAHIQATYAAREAADPVRDDIRGAAA